MIWMLPGVLRQWLEVPRFQVPVRWAVPCFQMKSLEVPLGGHYWQLACFHFLWHKNEINWKVRGWVHFPLTYIMWTPRLQLNVSETSQRKSTDLVGQLYLNSDWVESFPSETGLVYPGKKRTPQKIVQSIIPYFGSKYVNLGRAKTSHVV